MSIGHLIKVIGRGKEGARPLSRQQASEVWGLILEGRVSDLELGAFCIAMRIKGETAQEMAGFLDATHARLQSVALPPGLPAVVLPCYNGARKLPALTPLLALLLARRGVAVVVHGAASEVDSTARVSSQSVLALLGVPTAAPSAPSAPSATQAAPSAQVGQAVFVPTHALHPGLAQLLAVRRVLGLRNSGHSLVKLMNPCSGPALLVTSYTHPEYLHAMSATLALTGQHALLLRGTEGEPVADARRTPAMDVCAHGQWQRVQAQQDGPLGQVPDLPAPDAVATAAYTQRVLQGDAPVPPPIALQVAHVLRALDASTASTASAANAA